MKQLINKSLQTENVSAMRYFKLLILIFVILIDISSLELQGQNYDLILRWTEERANEW